jgi:two-component system cell cycle sensor histidine kinase/response regulator CckA
MTHKATRTILFVEDDELIAKLAEFWLAGAGYSVLLATNGAAALEVYQREGEHINLVVLDLSMPGLTCQEILEELGKLNAGLRVLITTGSQAAPVWLAHYPVYAGFLPKPYRGRELLSALAVALSERLTSPRIDSTYSGF